jgi:molybdenum cofactor cytidylyltransferase
MVDRVAIASVVLAAGRSQRMGQPKMLLPWGSTTVLGRVVQVLLDAGLKTVRVVTGGAEKRVEEVLANFPIKTVPNPNYERTEMLTSLLCGVGTLDETISAVLVVLGDQPQIEASTINAILERYQSSKLPLVIPSYLKRRGHPWLVDRSLWTVLAEAALDPKYTMRDFLNQHADLIDYVDVDTPSILKDLDTPQDYAAERP